MNCYEHTLIARQDLQKKSLDSLKRFIANQNSKKARPKKKENFGNYVAHLSHFTGED